MYIYIYIYTCIHKKVEIFLTYCEKHIEGAVHDEIISNLPLVRTIRNIPYQDIGDTRQGCGT